jgi:hypothetical protein
MREGDVNETIEAKPYFERGDTSLDGFPAETYVAGLRAGDGTIDAEIRLPAELVETTILTDARLSIWLALDGRLVLDGEGVGDEALEAAGAAGGLGQQTLESLVAASLDPAHLAAEDDPMGDPASLRAQLVRALAQVDEALRNAPRLSAPAVEM